MKKWLFLIISIILLAIPASAGNELLELESLNSHVGYTSIIVEGAVKNISEHPLHNVMAVAIGLGGTWGDEFISSEDSFIDYNPILPDQTSPFKIYLGYNPSIKKVKVEFKQFGGGTIPSKNRFD